MGIFVNVYIQCYKLHTYVHVHNYIMKNKIMFVVDAILQLCLGMLETVFEIVTQFLSHCLLVSTVSDRVRYNLT